MGFFLFTIEAETLQPQASLRENDTLLSTEPQSQPVLNNPPLNTSTPIKESRGVMLMSTPEMAPSENREAEEAVIPGQVAANISISVVGQNETDEIKRVKKGSVG